MERAETTVRKTATSKLGEQDDARIGGWLAWTVVALFAAVLIVAVLLVGQLLAGSRRTVTSERGRVTALEKLARERPSDLELRGELAFAYQRAGRFEDALSQYRMILSGDANDLAALYNSGSIYFGLGDEVRGEELLLKVLRLAPTHDLAANLLGEYYRDKGQYERVVDVVVPAADAHPELADLQCLAGLGLERTGRKTEAVLRFRRALELVPDMAEARAGLLRLGESDD